MKIILAPDKFKGNMPALEVCSIMKRAFLDVMPNAEIISIPMADGGEGTVQSIISSVGGEIRKVVVAGPFGDPVEAEFGIYNGGASAIMEMSSASGMALVPKEKLNPLLATSYGTGELIKAALDAGVREITIGIGGSATVDGGAGMAQALGYRLLDASGCEIPRGGGGLAGIAKVDAGNADKRIFSVKINIACDVTNPLLGANGAAAVYAPQKGATPEMVDLLEANLGKLSELWIKDGFLRSAECPGDGAAGGLGAGLRAFCKAEPVSGAGFVMDATGFRKQLPGADLVVTGEGCTDSQTESGKLCSEIAAAAHESGVPVMLISGALKGDLERFNRTFDYAFSLSSGRVTLEEAIAGSKEDLRFIVLNLAALLKKGFSHGK